MGETSSISIVPVSFSREIEIAVISADTIVSTNATRPGTKRCALSSVGLYRIRAVVSIRSGPPPGTASRYHRCTIAVAYPSMMPPVLGSLPSVRSWIGSESPRPIRRSTSRGSTSAWRIVARLNPRLQPLLLFEICHDVEPVGGREPLPELQRGDVGRRVHDRELDVPHVGPDREPEEQHLHDREQDQDGQGLPVPEEVQRLLPHEPEEGPHAALPGRVSLRNTSSSVAAPTARRTSEGVPIAAIAPFTMMEIRRQYSASSR